MTNNETGNDEIQIDLVKLAKELLRRVPYIILCAVVFAAIAFVIGGRGGKPTYTATALMHVDYPIAIVEDSETEGEDEQPAEGESTSRAVINMDDVSAARTLVSNYTVVLKSQGVLGQVISQEGLPYTVQQLGSMVAASAVSSTEFFQITVTGSDGDEVVRIANALADILPERMDEVLSGMSVSVVDYAGTASATAPPSNRNKIILGAMAGAVLAAVVIVCVYLFGGKIHDEDYLMQAYPSVPVLAIVPDKSRPSSKERKDYVGSRPAAPAPAKKRSDGAARPPRPAEGEGKAPGEKKPRPAPGKRPRPARPAEGERAPRHTPDAKAERQPQAAEEEIELPVMEAVNEGEDESNGE